MGRKTKPVFERIEITGIGARGKAIARIDGLVTFVDNALPGDVADIRIERKRRSYQEGTVTRFHGYSASRTEPFCEHFGVCGGCRWQNLAYGEQLRYKQQEVHDALQRIGKVPRPVLLPIIPAPGTCFYRNKLEFTFSSRRWLGDDEIKRAGEISRRNALGLHVRGRYDRVVDLDNCYLQPEPSNSIRLFVRDYALQMGLSFFDPMEHKGFLRNLIIRTAPGGQAMVIVCFHEDDAGPREDLLAAVSEKFPALTSLMYLINPKANDSIHDLEVMLFSGQDHLIEELDGLRFRIGPKSFFQTNTLQALQLYRKVKEYSGLGGTETVYDLYTGTGTIACYLAGSAGKVVGIERVGEAVADARANAGINGIGNAEFFEGDIKKVLNTGFIGEHGPPGVLVTDPPRAGMHPKAVESILAAAPGRIIYISCNPATQARDVALLSERYRVSLAQPFDMFPHTYHVENICVLEPTC